MKFQKIQLLTTVWITALLFPGILPSFATSNNAGKQIPLNSTIQESSIDFKPDLLLKRQSDPDTSYMGDQIYQTSPAYPQVLSESIQPGSSANYSILLKNEGSEARTFALRLVSEDHTYGWSCSCKTNSTDITWDITGMGYVTPIINPGDSLLFEVSITAAQNAGWGGHNSYLLLVYDDNSFKKLGDAAQITGTTARSDLLIKSSSEADTEYQTTNVYQQVPSNKQIKTVDSVKGTSVEFKVKLQNSSDSASSYFLNAEESSDNNWTVNYKLDESSRLINTYAGGGSSIKDGTDAKSFELDPLSIAYDHHGNCYIGGWSHIWRIGSDNKVYCVAGGNQNGFSGDGGPALNAGISEVYGIAFDANDNLYFSDSRYSRIRRIDAQTGIITTVAGNGNEDFSGDGGLAINAAINVPNGIAIDSTGNIYFSDSMNNRIRRIDAITGKISTFAGTGTANYNGDGIPASKANLHYPQGIAFDTVDNLYVADHYNHRIRKIDSLIGYIHTIAGNGSYTHSGDGGPALQAGLPCPDGVCLDKDSNIYFTEDRTFVRKVDTKTGIITTISGITNDSFAGLYGDGGPAVLAKLYEINGIAIRDDGSLMLVDTCNKRIRIIESDTAIQGALSSGGYTTDRIPLFGNIVVDISMTPDYLVLPDTQKSVILRVYSNNASNVVMDSVKAVAHLPFFRQPDLLIESASDPYNYYYGDRIYQQIPSDTQIINQDVFPGDTAHFSAKLQNKGDVAQSFLLRSVENKLIGWNCSYFTNGTDITSSLIGNGYITPILNPGESITIDIAQIPSQDAVGGIPENLILGAYNDINDTTVEDSVEVNAVVKGPDLLIENASDTNATYETDNLYQQIPNGKQIQTAETSSSNPANFSIDLQNDLDFPRSYYLKTSESEDTGWTVSYSLSDNSRIITTYAGGGNSITDGTDALSYHINSLGSIALDRNGDLYVGCDGFIKRIDSKSGKVYTIAGDGSNGFSGDGGLATNAKISAFTYGIEFDNDNNLYFADYSNDRVRCINSKTGIITTIAGNGSFGFCGDGGLATDACLPQITRIAVDTAGNVYIADSAVNRIRRIDAVTHMISTVAGTGTYGYSGDGDLAIKANLATPQDIAIDSLGNLYIADTLNNRIRKIDHSTGYIQTIAGNGSSSHSGDGGSALQAGIPHPQRICMDKNSNIYVISDERALCKGTYIRKIDAKTGIITTIAGNGTVSSSGDGGLAILAGIRCASDLAIGNDDSIYIADGDIISTNSTIRRIDPPTAVQNAFTSGGYTTVSIPGHGSIMMNVMLTPSSTISVGSKKSVTFNVYLNDSDTIVRDSVTGIAKVTATQTTYSTPSGFIHSGWNLVSLPTDPINPDPLVVFTGIDVANSHFQYWNNNTNPSDFQYYGEAYGWTGPVVRGTPYWFRSSSDVALSFNGIIPVSDFEMTIPAHTAAPYWIAVGTPFPSAVSADAIRFKDVAKRGDNWLTWADAYSSANSDFRIVDSSMQGWDASQNSFVLLAPSAFALAGDKTQFDPWWGYWLLVMDPNELKIQFPKPVQ